MAKICIQFHNVPANESIGHHISFFTNELVLQDLPDEANLLKVNNKVPGLGLQLDASELNLLYKEKYSIEIPNSYEHLLLDVIDSNSHLFTMIDELDVTWKILTPDTREIDEKKIISEFYEFGGRS